MRSSTERIHKQREPNAIYKIHMRHVKHAVQFQEQCMEGGKLIRARGHANKHGENRFTVSQVPFMRDR